MARLDTLRRHATFDGPPVASVDLPRSAVADPPPVPVECLISDREVEEIWGGMEPETYREIVQVFVAELEQRMRRLAAAAAGDDGQALARQAHAIKGAAANVGAVPLSEAAAALEQEAGDSRPEAARRRVADLHELARRTIAALAELTSQPCSPPAS